VDELTTLGWNDRLREEFEQHRVAGLVAGRVSVQHRGAWDVLTEHGELRVDAAGRLRHDASSTAALPVVGDWVAIAERADETSGTIQAVLPRRTKVSRKTAWQATEEQVLVANIDVIFLVTSVNEDLNPRRLERYLTLAWESGARPVFVLTKADLLDDVGPAVALVESVAFGVPVLPISSVSGVGIEQVHGYLPVGTTGAFIGSSGVGKSTLVNALAGEELLETREIRSDGRGRHTTVRRELIVLPGGGLIIDTPGMRELQLWDADEGLDEAFEDVASLFAHCRFSDCRHDREPGCAVQAALADGTLPRERWESYLTLQAELERLERRQDLRLQAEEKRKWKARSAEARENMRLKGNDG
jgi:ribosome biogenesis GTPase / thiamine phosphate phosphatase